MLTNEPGQVAQAGASNADNDVAYVYVTFFLIHLTRDVTFRFASPRILPTIAAACAHLCEVVVPEPGYREFLRAQIEKWDGQAVHVTTTVEGSLILMPTPFAVDQV